MPRVACLRLNYSAETIAGVSYAEILCKLQPPTLQSRPKIKMEVIVLELDGKQALIIEVEYS